MPSSTNFVPIAPDRLAKGVAPAAKEVSAKFPKKATGTGLQGVSALHGFVAARPALKAPVNPAIRIKPMPVTAKALGQFRAIVDSASAPGEMLNRMGPDAFLGTLYTALVTAEYLKARGAYQKVQGRNDTEVEAQWKAVTAGFVGALTAVGHRGVTVAALDGLAKTLSANQANLNAVMRIANSAVADETGGAKNAARFVAAAVVLPSLDSIITAIPGLCTHPFATGTYTKHFHQGFSWQVSVPYPCFDWCSKWGIPYPCNFRICHKTVTLAGVSFDLDLNVGYRVDCCGATAWGQASVQACGTVLNITQCATCTATIVGLAGLSRTPVASGCSYGLGVTATLECKVAGQTVFYASVPFGWTVTGPCPPAGFPC